MSEGPSTAELLALDVISPEARLEATEREGVSLFLQVLIGILVVFTPLTWAMNPVDFPVNAPLRLVLVLVFGGLVVALRRPRPFPAQAPAAFAVLTLSGVILVEVAQTGDASHPFFFGPAFVGLGLAMFVPLPGASYALIAALMTLLPWPLWIFDLLPADPRVQALYTTMMLTLAVAGAFASEQRRQALVTSLHAQQRLRAKTMELEEALVELEHAQERLVVVERKATVGRMATGIAENVGEPVGAIRAQLDHAMEAVQAAQDGGEAELEAVSEALQEASFATDRMSRFLEELGGGGRALETGASARIHVMNELRVVVNQLAYRMVDDLEVDVSGSEGIEVHGDPRTFDTVMTQLVDNALDAHEEAGVSEPVRVTVGLTGQGVEIRVIDQGSGVDQTVVDRLFEPLVSTKPLHKGTGLGLAMARDLVVGDFGGTLRYEETPGGGATFVVTMPAVS